MITYEDFSKLELKVGKVLEANDHPNADRLYVLKVDLGATQVQLVAGIKNYYTKEELIGKLVIIVVNLEPKVLRGVESNGMLLAAHSEDKIVILTADREVSPGSFIK
ncbi:MAG: methionine--tRNA ligase subunit beta [Candidatus Omnitrophica bacterium]|jgi:methionyl-tRNA synthetase|nr:methionine--tRNA ligase subunit beta [Candidatus Omnitrophota bacterium]